MVSVKHHFVTAKADGPDSTRVRPTAWNEEHDFLASAGGVVLGRALADGPGPIQELPMGSVFSPGMVLPFAGTVAPTGWHVCDGGSLTRADNLQLYLAIGTTYGPGSSPGTTFAKPNLKGRTIAGVDPDGTLLTSATMSPNGATLGAIGGQQTEAAGVNVSGMINVAFGGGPAGAIGMINGGSINVGGSGVIVAGFGDPVVVTLPYIPSSGNNAMSGATVAVTNVQPTLLMNWLIKG